MNDSLPASAVPLPSAGQHRVNSVRLGDKQCSFAPALGAKSPRSCLIGVPSLISNEVWSRLGKYLPG